MSDNFLATITAVPLVLMFLFFGLVTCANSVDRAPERMAERARVEREAMQECRLRCAPLGMECRKMRSRYKGRADTLACVIGDAP